VEAIALGRFVKGGGEKWHSPSIPTICRFVFVKHCVGAKNGSLK